jgi:hypothetical protein
LYPGFKYAGRGLNDAAAAALQNFIIMLHEMVSQVEERWDESWAVSGKNFP